MKSTLKLTLIIILGLITLFLPGWLFNHVNAYLGIAVGILVFSFLCVTSYKYLQDDDLEQKK